MNKMDSWQHSFKEKDILLWGTSIGARQAVDLLDECNLKGNIVAYFDNAKAKWGTYIGGIPVMCPSDLPRTCSRNQNVIICITSIFWDQIGAQIRNLGVDVPIYVFLWYNPCELKSGCEYSPKEKEEIASFYDLTDAPTDVIVKNVLDYGLVNARKFGPWEKYRNLGGVDAYFYEKSMQKLVDEEMTLTLLDVGAYDGSSIKQMRDVFRERLKKVHAFEPSSNNFAVLSKNLNGRNNVFLHNYALNDVSETVSFIEDGPFFRMTYEDNNKEADVVECLKLDDLDLEIEGRPILKLDVEGSEMKALRGAAKFIKRYRPILVVCVYHRDYDIADIPRYVKNLVPEYKAYLRGGTHTVAYFI